MKKQGWDDRRAKRLLILQAFGDGLHPQAVGQAADGLDDGYSVKKRMTRLTASSHTLHKGLLPLVNIRQSGMDR